MTDHLNTVRDIARYDSESDTTTVVNHLVYDAYGNVTSETNSAVESLFLFTARPFDPDTGLQNNLHRWYDPAVGRWLSEDPIGFTRHMSLYDYAQNSPLTRADPTGLENFYVCGRVVGAGPGLGRCTAHKCGWLHTAIYGDESGLVYEGWYGGSNPKERLPVGPGVKCYPLRRATLTIIAISPGPYPIPPIEKQITWGAAKGKLCRDATDSEILACLLAKPGKPRDQAPGAVSNCQTDCFDAAEGCCLTGFRPATVVPLPIFGA